MKGRIQKSIVLYTLIVHSLIAGIGIYLEHHEFVIKIQFAIVFAALVLSMTQVNGKRIQIGSGIMLGSVIAMAIYMILYFIFFFRLNAVC
jgi:uncharacterized membrane protein YagU involved in acid resistance